MTTIDLLAELHRRGVELRADGDRLRFRPVSAVTPDLKAALTTHKAAILDALTSDTGKLHLIGPGGVPVSATSRGYTARSDLPERWREYYDERAAVREYDGGQPREHAEVEAWRETLAAMRIRNGT